MKFVTDLHPWNVSAKEAQAIQQNLRSQVVIKRPAKRIQIVAGTDVSYRKESGLAHAAVVLLSFPDMEIIAHEHYTSPYNFPYVPGLLSFREAPHLLEVFRRLKIKPDVVIVDGQGLAHPRRLGLASHLGLWLDVPTIGCAKSRLTGKFDPPGETVGSAADLHDGEEIIGHVLRSKKGCKPLFISVGHLIDLTSAVEIVSTCLKGYRLPEPTRQAHLLVKQL